MTQLLYPWRKNLQYPLNRRLDGFQGQPGYFEKEISLAPAGIQTLDHPVRSLATTATRTAVLLCKQILSSYV